MSDIYEDDILLWSEQQAALLRLLAAGERVNDQFDWENVAAKLYREALRRLPERVDDAAPLPVPQACPVTLEELLAEPPEA